MIAVVRRAAPWLLAALISLAAVFFGLNLWSIDWRIPLYYSGDALAVASHFKTVIETGWFTHQPDLGAPYGQFYSDYPQADNLHFIAADLLRLVTSDFGVAMNVYFVIGFPLAAVTAWWFLRLVGVGTPLAVALGVVYSIAPYHFIKGEGHLFLAAYFVVPLALGLVVLVATGRPLWRLRPAVRADGTPEPRLLRPLTGRNAATVGIVALLGTASSYYSVFVALVLAVAGLATLWRTRAWRRFWGATAAGVLIAVVMLVNLTPSILYRLANGVNEAVLVRSPPEAELYSFKLSSLLLPVPGHRFGPFATLRQLYDTYYPLPSEEPALGLVAAAGFVALVVVAVHLLLSAGRTGWRMPAETTRTLSVLAGLTLVAFLFGTVGGLSTLLSFVDFPIRSWNRIAILIALFALAAVGLLLQRVVARRAALAVPLAVLLVALAVWDQIPPVDDSARAATVAAYRSDESFTQQVEASVEPGCLIYQLPYIAFPESPPVNGVLDSDELRPFLHSDELRWSAGGIKGRAPIDAQGAIASLPVPEMLDGVQGLGACALVLDRAAYTDQGSTIVEEISTTIGDTTAFDSPDGRFTFLELPPR